MEAPLDPPPEKISPLHQSAHLAIRDAPLQHPETTVGMDIPQPAGPKRLHNILNARRDQLGGLTSLSFMSTRPIPRPIFGSRSENNASSSYPRRANSSTRWSTWREFKNGIRSRQNPLNMGCPP